MTYDLKFEKIGPFEFLTSPRLLRERSILILFTTRNGGVSNPPYDSLNLAFHVGDAEEHVIENRTRLCSSLEISRDDLTTAQQVHGDSVAIVSDHLIGSGSGSYETAIPGTDALITKLPKIPLAVFLADCLPVVLVDSVQKTIAVVHAGWKGMELRSISLVTQTLVDEFGSDPSGILAFVGPAIGSCCYQIDSKRARIFSGITGSVRREDGSLYLDLMALARWQLLDEGLRAENIIEAGMCTSCLSGRFFSFRRQPVTGRQAAMAMIF